jgi:hypothetical protein
MDSPDAEKDERFMQAWIGALGTSLTPGLSALMSQTILLFAELEVASSNEDWERAVLRRRALVDDGEFWRVADARALAFRSVGDRDGEARHLEIAKGIKKVLWFW